MQTNHMKPRKVQPNRLQLNPADLKSNIVEVDHLNVFYTEKENILKKADAKKQVLYDVSFMVKFREVLGLVGESGCGKSTLAKALLGLNTDIEGEIRHFSERPQMIFQDPYSSLNPARTIGWILEEPLKISGGSTKEDRKERVMEMLKKVGLSDSHYARKPRELSGGQRQRVSIAQALINRPRFIIADEPVSSLDVTIQSQIMDLMLELQEEMKLSYLFISHDINVIYQMCDRLMVMKDGRIIEYGPVHQLFSNAQNEYTKILLK